MMLELKDVVLVLSIKLLCLRPKKILAPYVMEVIVFEKKRKKILAGLCHEESHVYVTFPVISYKLTFKYMVVIHQLAKYEMSFFMKFQLCVYWHTLTFFFFNKVQQEKPSTS
jgi:hypothetical protein